MAVIINGNNTPPAGGIAYGNATSELAFTAAGIAGQLVLSGGAGAPTFATTLPVANGGTGTATPSIVAGANVTVTGTWPNQTIAASSSGTVSSVAQSFTGGIVSVAGSPITSSGTLALTIAGTSGGIPYFSSGTTWATSAALTANAIVLGGGAGSAPATTATGTGVVTALGINTGSSGAFVVNGGALGTPSSGTLTSATGLPISTGVSGLGTGVATALAINVGSAGAPVVNGGALGTPSSGTATNLTGLPLSTGVTGTLPVANGGTGASTLTANNVVLGNGTSAPLFVAPSTAGNVLTSNGTTWTSTTPAAGTTDLLENAQIISTNYVIAALKNAIALGTITINTASSVTVGTDQSWLIFS